MISLPDAPRALVIRAGAAAEPVSGGFACVEIVWPRGGRALPDYRLDLIIVDFPVSQPVNLAVLGDIRRQTELPTIVLGADHPTDRILSLELGADDYLGKPVSMRELRARAAAMLRATQGPAATRGGGLLGRWTLDNRRRCLVADGGEQRKLRPVEYGLLSHFIAHPFTVHDRDTLAQVLSAAQQRPYTARSVDVFVNLLRRKLDDTDGRMFQTDRGQGYAFRPV